MRPSHDQRDHTQNDLRNGRFLPVWAFCVPAVCFLTVCAFLRIVPFGGSSLLIQDMSGQYISYFAYLKDMLAEGNDFFYTFSKNMGGDMAGFSAYYLLSPLNVLFILFPKDQFPSCVTVLAAVKIGLCGATCAVFLRDRVPSKFALLLSTSYALMSYNIVYVCNIMWLDGVYMLPLVALGIERILTGSGIGMYVLSLAYALITNYYIGYMLCVFSVFYYLFQMVSIKLEKLPLAKGQFWNYAKASLLAGGISAIVLVPTFMSLYGTKATFDIDLFAFRLNFPLRNLLAKLFTGTITWLEMVAGLPHIFCGLLVTILIVLYFLNKQVDFRVKAASALSLLLLVLCFAVNPLNLVWHGFSLPYGFSYRNSFVFSFMLIWLAAQGVRHMSGNLPRHIFYTALVIFGVVFVLKTEDFAFLNSKSICLDCVLVCAMLIPLYAILKGGRSRYAVTALLLLQIASLTINALSLQSLPAQQAAIYSEYVGSVSKQVDQVKQHDPGFYRMEKTFFRSLNDAMLFSYNGLSHFSSCEKTFVKDFMGKLGFRNYGAWAYYNQGSTAAVDAFLGVKYLVSDVELTKPYLLLSDQSSVQIYENPFVLPVGFCAHSAVLDARLHETDYFKRQNDIFSAMVGAPVALFSPADIGSIQEENVTSAQNQEYVQYTRADPGEAAAIHYQVQAKSHDLLYMYLSAPSMQSAELFVNGRSLGKYFDTYQWGIVCLGKFEVGDVIDVCVRLDENTLQIGTAYFYHEASTELEKCHDILAPAGNTPTVEKRSSSHLKWSGTVTGEDSAILFTIPMERGWTATLDGKAVALDSAFGTLIALKAPPGAHVVELRYVPPGFYLGCVISGACVLLFLVRDRKAIRGWLDNIRRKKERRVR